MPNASPYRHTLAPGCRCEIRKIVVRYRGMQRGKILEVRDDAQNGKAVRKIPSGDSHSEDENLFPWSACGT